jgi:hypothetical protein
MSDIRELAVDRDASRDHEAFAQAALRRVNRASTTVKDLVGEMEAESATALLVGKKEVPSLPGIDP